MAQFTAEQINAFAQSPAGQKILGGSATPPPAPVAPTDPGFFHSVGQGLAQGVGEGIQGIGTLAKTEGAPGGLVNRVGNSLQTYGGQMVTNHPEVAPSFSDHPLDYIGEAAGHMLGRTATGIAGAAAGGALGSAVGPEGTLAGAAGGFLGGTLAQAPVEIGSSLQAQEASGQAPNLARAVPTGLATAGLEFIPGGVGSLLGKSIGRAAPGVVETALQNAQKGLVSKVTSSIGKITGTALEQGAIGGGVAAINTVGNAVDNQTGLQNLTSPEGIKNVLESAGVNALAGGAIRGAHLPIETMRDNAAVTAASKAGDPIVQTYTNMGNIAKSFPNKESLAAYAQDNGIDLGGATKYEDMLKTVATKQTEEARNNSTPLTAANNIDILKQQMPDAQAAKDFLTANKTPFDENAGYEDLIKQAQKVSVQNHINELMGQHTPAPDLNAYHDLQDQAAMARAQGDTANADLLSTQAEKMIADHNDALVQLPTRRAAVADQLSTLQNMPFKSADHQTILDAATQAAQGRGHAEVSKEAAAKIKNIGENVPAMATTIQRAVENGASARDVEAYAEHLSDTIAKNPELKDKLPTNIDPVEVALAARSAQMQGRSVKDVINENIDSAGVAAQRDTERRQKAEAYAEATQAYTEKTQAHEAYTEEIQRRNAELTAELAAQQAAKVKATSKAAKADIDAEIDKVKQDISDLAERGQRHEQEWATQKAEMEARIGKPLNPADLVPDQFPHQAELESIGKPSDVEQSIAATNAKLTKEAQRIAEREAKKLQRERDVAAARLEKERLNLGKEVAKKSSKTPKQPERIAENVLAESTSKPDSEMVRNQAETLKRVGKVNEPAPTKTFDSAALIGHLAKRDTASTLKVTSDYLAKLPGMKPVADWLRTAAKGVKVSLSDEAPMQDGRPVQGMYDPKTDTVTIYRTGVHPAIVAHELVHALTERSMQRAEDVLAGRGAPATAADRKLVEAYKSVLQSYAAFKQEMPDSASYGFTNEREFLSEVLSNPDFRGELMSRPQTSLWGKVLGAIRSLLGLKKSDTRALNDVFLNAQTLAYNAPGVTFMPREYRKLFYTGDAHDTIQRHYDAVNKDLNAVKKFWSMATDKARRVALYAMSTHNMNEIWGENDRGGLGFRGVGRMIDAQANKAAMESQLNTELGQFGDGFQSFRKGNPTLFTHLMTGLNLHSQFRLTEAQIHDVLAGRESYESLLAKEKEKSGTNSDVIATQLENIGKANFDRMVNSLKTIKWNEKYDLTKPHVERTANDWGHAIFKMTAQAAERRYEAAIRNEAFRVFHEDSILDRKQTKLDDVIARVMESHDMLARDEIAQARKEFKMSQRIPYIPTFRRGDFWVGVRDSGGENGGKGTTSYFQKFTSQVEAEAFYNRLEADQSLKERGLTASYGKVADLEKQSIESSALMRLVKRTADQMDTIHQWDGADSQQIRDALMQSAYLAMPETSNLKSLLHRKGTSGWNPEEQFQGFMEHMIHSNYSYATQFHMPLMEQAIDHMQSHIKQLNDPTKFGIKPNPKLTPIIAQEVADELNKRLVNSTKEVTTPRLDAARSFTYNWQLALSPSYMIANLTQPYVLTLPTLGAKYGYGAAAKSMLSSLRLSASIVGSMLKRGLSGVVLNDELMADLAKKQSGGKPVFSPEQLRAISSMLSSGKVDFTLAKEAGQLARGTSGSQAKLMRILSSGSHYVEVINRITSGLAAHELEMSRQKGKGITGEAAEKLAQEKALWAITDTQFIYDRYNQGRAMGRQGIAGNMTPLFSTFQNYNVMLMEKYARHAMQWADKDLEPEMRAEARRAITGMLLTAASLAGVAGLPLASAVMAGAQALSGSDDDIDASIRSWANQTFGHDVGTALVRGLPSAAGVDVSNTMGQQGILPFSYTMFSGKSLGQMSATDFLKGMSPVLGTGLGVVQLVPNTYNWIANGDGTAANAMVQGLPGALRGVGRDVIGNRDASGMPIPGNNSASDIIMQAAGLTPADREEQLFASFAARDKQQRITAKAAAIRTGMIHAMDEGDSEAVAQWRQQAAEFSQQYPLQPNIFKSVQEGAKKIQAKKAFYANTNLGNYMTPRQMLINKALNDSLGLGYNDASSE